MTGVSTIGETTVTAYGLSGSDQALVTKAGRYKGLSVRETAAAAASIVLYDNASAASGTIIATVALAASESVNIDVEGDGVLFTNGIYVDVTGSVQGSVRVR